MLHSHHYQNFEDTVKHAFDAMPKKEAEQTGETCPQCGGAGRVQQMHQTILGSISQIVTCPNCHGKGTIIKDFCPDCKGAGKVQKEKTCIPEYPIQQEHNLELMERYGTS